MSHDLVINLAIVISFLSIGGQLFKDKPMDSTITMKLLGGIIAGLLGSILMVYSIKVSDTTIVDLRNFAVIISSLYGGVFSGILAGIIIGINRILFFGINISSITAFIMLLVIPIICGGISKTKISFKMKFFYMNISQLFVFYIAVSYLISDKQKLLDVSLYYGLFSLIGGLIIFQICNYITRSNQNYRLLKESAQKDHLTGLNNVRHFDHIWNVHVQNVKENKEMVSLLMIDIDHFKKVNDTFGHPVGDKILKELGIILNNNVRSVDTVCRNGGEEFSVILPDCSNDKAIEIAERIRSAVEEHDFFISKTDKINITVSIGVANFPETNDIDEMINKADACLYKAKRSGRNQVSSYI